MNEAAYAMSKAVELLRENKSPLALELACTLGEWWFSSKEYDKAIECMEECAQEHLVDGNELGTANDFYLIGCAYRELKNYEKAISTFLEAREYFKVAQEVIQVARCDQNSLIATWKLEMQNLPCDTPKNQSMSLLQLMISDA
jgi:tetratricopeptide (TPR) repeat protein